MKTQVTGIVPLLACLFLILVVTADEGDTKLIKKSIHAADGLNLVCEVRGKGDTALVFLHGWCGDRDYWKHQVDVFAVNYRIATLDQAGHGQSGKDRQKWTIDGLAVDVERVKAQQHDAGVASRYTRSRLPVVVVYQETHSSRSSALRREAAIKALSRRQKMALIRLAG